MDLSLQSFFRVRTRSANIKDFCEISSEKKIFLNIKMENAQKTNFVAGIFGTHK